MLPFIYQCSVTGLKVQGLSDKPSFGSLETVKCLACGRLHVIDPKVRQDDGPLPGSSSSY